MHGYRVQLVLLREGGQEKRESYVQWSVLVSSPVVSTVTSVCVKGQLRTYTLQHKRKHTYRSLGYTFPSLERNGPSFLT